MNIKIRYICDYLVFEVKEENLNFETSLIDISGAEYYIDIFTGLIEELEQHITYVKRKNEAREAKIERD